MSATANALILTTMMLDATIKAQQLAAILNKAAAEGRDVSDAEVAAARAAAVTAGQALDAAIAQMP